MTQPKPIYVTQPYLPPLEEFTPYLEKIWANKILTNGGPFHQQLEKELCDYLGVKHICLFTNGTIALVTALQALRITGEVITTPYSFVATAHSLLWNGIKPVFVDVDPNTLNMDPAKIEAAITPHTTAIMPVHCYGHPCDVDAIQKIADNYNLKVVYDAAHAFGVQCHCGSVLNHGDLSVLSFHATKVFNTFEGGAIICPDAKTKTRIDQLKNFGHVGGLGEFDEFGTYPVSVIKKGDEVRAYYAGWTRCESVPFNVAIGMATSQDGGQTFTKLGTGPVLSYSPDEPFVLSGPKVRRFNDTWYLWYIAGRKWKIVAGKAEPVYKIRMASSSDGIHWNKVNKDLIESRIEEDEAQASPDVFYANSKYHMFFCYRYSSHYRGKANGYRIGYASSTNLTDWLRDDSKAGIDVSDEG